MGRLINWLLGKKQPECEIPEKVEEPKRTFKPTKVESNRIDNETIVDDPVIQTVAAIAIIDSMDNSNDYSSYDSGYSYDSGGGGYD